MKALLIAQTAINWHGLIDTDYVEHPLYDWAVKPDEMDELPEIAGRLCYKSWDRPNPATATNQGYLANILDHQHFSVLEHSSATFWISGVSRSLTHELVRHRHFSFSQVSQRYVDESDAEFVVPPDIHTAVGDDPDLVTGAISALAIVSKAADDGAEGYRDLIFNLERLGWDRKKARQAARSVLPNATATEIIVTGNLRSWREFIQKRLSPHADAEIRELAKVILTRLLVEAPNALQDLKYLVEE